MTDQYNSEFYRRNRRASLASAEAIIPMLIEAIQPLNSVIDVGCGDGEWLSVFQRLGVYDVFGLDGGIGVDANIMIDKDTFKCVNLEEKIEYERQFDLLLCVEVAEHLPESRAAGFVGDLCRISPVIAFSAAIPFQGGTGHINEQWQSYWGRLFSRFGYEPIDFIRPRIWQRTDVAAWYAQNLIVYVKSGQLENYPKLQVEANKHIMFDVAHPRIYELGHKLENWTFRRMVKGLIVLAKNSLVWHGKNILGRTRS